MDKRKRYGKAVELTDGRKAYPLQVEIFVTHSVMMKALSDHAYTYWLGEPFFDNLTKSDAFEIVNKSCRLYGKNGQMDKYREDDNGNVTEELNEKDALASAWIVKHYPELNQKD